MFTTFNGRSIFTEITGVPERRDWERMVTFERFKNHGDYAKVANKTGYSTPYVWRVLNNQRGQNQSILKAAFGLVRRAAKADGFLPMSV